MPKKKNNIKMDREAHKKMREKAGYQYRFVVDRPRAYNHYDFLKKISLKKKKGGDKKE